MAEDIHKIDEVFRMQDENSNKTGHIKPDALNNFDNSKKKGRKEKKTENKAAGKPEKESKKKDKNIQINPHRRTGCIGGIMYFVFIICVSVVLACVAWMAASDALALNKPKFEATITLPPEIFKSETVDTFDEDGNKTGTKRISVADMDYVTDQLKEAGLIEYKWLFNFFGDISHADKKLSPGEYELKSTYDYRALITHMRAGSDTALTVDVTIPEGFTMHQIFKRLEENKVCSYDDLMAAAADYNYNYSFLEDKETGDSSRLEGFLFPETYQFYVDMQASSAINKFLDVFYMKFDANMINTCNNLGMSMDDVITIASMIEKEAASDEERATIASVIYNRLNAGMPLGIDATLLYEYPDHEGAPTAEMLENDSPYNSRINTGLPPTPICNPGLASINAALAPEETNYYYYALDTETGTHRFFATEGEHSAFVATQNYE